MFRTCFRIGDIAILLLVLAPLVETWPSLSGTGLGDMRTWGKVFGILGLSMILSSAITSVRIPRSDVYFGGLTRLWNLHHHLGFFGFIFVMFHVWFILIAALPASLASAVYQIFPIGSGWPIWIGWMSFGLLSIFLAPSFKFFGNMRYQKWKVLHLLSAPALALAILHAILLTRHFYSWALLSTMAITAIIWRKVLSPKYGRYDYSVAECKFLANDVVELGLKPMDSSIRYQSGQFVYLSPLDRSLQSGYNEEHPYTISSAPSDALLRIGIKDFGDGSKAIQKIAIGSLVKIEGPYGNFFERFQPAKKMLWFGGGIGVTPFVSAFRDPSRSDAHLIYMTDHRDRAYYAAELARHLGAKRSLSLTSHHFQIDGPITIDFVQRHCPDFMLREVYICGPSPMVKHLIKMLTSQGLSKLQIHTEVFELL